MNSNIESIYLKTSFRLKDHLIALLSHMSNISVLDITDHNKLQDNTKKRRLQGGRDHALKIDVEIIDEAKHYLQGIRLKRLSVAPKRYAVVPTPTERGDNLIVNTTSKTKNYCPERKSKHRNTTIQRREKKSKLPRKNNRGLHNLVKHHGYKYITDPQPNKVKLPFNERKKVPKRVTPQNNIPTENVNACCGGCLKALGSYKNICGLCRKEGFWQCKECNAVVSPYISQSAHICPSLQLLDM